MESHLYWISIKPCLRLSFRRGRNGLLHSRTNEIPFWSTPTKNLKHPWTRHRWCYSGSSHMFLQGRLRVFESWLLCKHWIWFSRADWDASRQTWHLKIESAHPRRETKSNQISNRLGQWARVVYDHAKQRRRYFTKGNPNARPSEPNVCKCATRSGSKFLAVKSAT